MLPITTVISDVRLLRTDVPSQVTIPERKVLKFLAATLDKSAGAIVDLGAGAGSSTLALAEGLMSRVDDWRPLIHAYDWFSIGPGHYATQDFKSVSDPADQSFLADFQYFLTPYAEHTRVHSGDIKLERWAGEPIALLHVDLAKDFSIFKHIALEFFPHVQPGGILVHQDFSRPRLPWLHFSAGIMTDSIKPIYRTGGSVFYRVVEPITRELMEVVIGEWPLAERKAYARGAVETAKSADGLYVEHFACLAEMVDIYLDYWFGSRKEAAERLAGMPSEHAVRKHYPEAFQELGVEKNVSGRGRHARTLQRHVQLWLDRGRRFSRRRDGA